MQTQVGMTIFTTWPNETGTSVRRWIPACRLIAAAVLAAAILTSGWFPGPPVPAWARLSGLAVSAGLVILALMQFASAASSSRRIAVAALALDAAAAERSARVIELEGHRRRFHDIVWDLDAIVWESDVAGHQFYFVSHPAERILGYPVDRWLSEPGFRAKVIHPEDRRRAISKYGEVAAAGKRGQFEYRMVSSENGIVWVSDRVTPVRDPDGRVRQLRGVTLDITRRKQAEEGLRNSFGMLFANNPLPMWAYERDTLRFLAVNDAAVELYGYTREDFLGMRI